VSVSCCDWTIKPTAFDSVKSWRWESVCHRCWL